MVTPGTMFEEFGFNYIGPDRRPRPRRAHPDAEEHPRLKGPQFLHVVTRKGQGYKLAEADPVLYHGVVASSTRRGHRRRQVAAASRPTRRSSATGCATWPSATRAGRRSRRRCARARAWCEFAERFPERYFDVGIAEQHAVTFAAGLACEGAKPVVAIYSTFLQRGYDQLIHDVQIQNLPVMFALDRAGLVGRRRRDPPRRVRPRLPALPAQHDGDGARRRERMPPDALHGLHGMSTPAAVRYPRGAGPGVRGRAGNDGAARGPRRDPRAARRWRCSRRRSPSSPSARCSRLRSPSRRSSTRRWPTCAS